MTVATQNAINAQSATGLPGIQGAFPYFFDRAFPVDSTGVNPAVPVYWDATAASLREWDRDVDNAPIGVVWNDQVDAGDFVAGGKRFVNTDAEVRQFGGIQVQCKGAVGWNDPLRYNGDGTWSEAAGASGDGLLVPGLQVIATGSSTGDGFVDAYVSMAPAGYGKVAGQLNFALMPNPIIVPGIVGAIANLGGGRGVKKSSGKYIAGTDASIDGVLLPQATAWAVDGKCLVAIDAALAVPTTSAMKAGDRAQYGTSNRFVNHSATQQYSAILCEDTAATGTPWTRFRA